jgi:hypothetical protein
VTLRGRRILLATVAIWLAGSTFGEQALAVELPPLPSASEPVPSVVPTIDAVAAPALPEPAGLVTDAVASVEPTAQDLAATATEVALPSVDVAVTAPAVVEQAVDVQTVESGAAVRRTEPAASRDPSPTRAARKTAEGGKARAVSPSGSAAERTEAPSFVPGEAEDTSLQPSQPAPSGAAGTALLQGASTGGTGLLFAAALSIAFGVQPRAGGRRIPASTLLRRTLVTSILEDPG